MKTCPKCSATFPSHFTVCPQDATPLRHTSELAEGAILRGKYQILGRIGQGGMGVVYKARHIRFDEICALKLVSSHLAADEEFLRRFHAEAMLMRKLEHPHALRVHDIDETEDGHPFIVMEYFQGRSLDRLVREEGPLPVARACRIVAQACGALDAAHRLGIVHRDIKPSNLLVAQASDGSDFAKVFDFGIAKVKDSSELRQGVSLTRTGFLVGTPAYMSPEQAQGLRGDKLDGRSDLYSLGIVLFEILTGRLPFQDETPASLLVAHLQTPPPNPRDLRADLPQPLSDVILRALQKDPADRFATAAEMQVALDALAAEAAGSATMISASALAADAGASAFTQPHTPLPRAPQSKPAFSATERVVTPPPAPPSRAPSPPPFLESPVMVEAPPTAPSPPAVRVASSEAAEQAKTRSFLLKLALGFGAVILVSTVVIFQAMQPAPQTNLPVTPPGATPQEPAGPAVVPQQSPQQPAGPVATGGPKAAPPTGTAQPEASPNSTEPKLEAPALPPPTTTTAPAPPSASLRDWVPPPVLQSRPSPTEVPGTVDLSSYLNAIAASSEGFREVAAAPPGFVDGGGSDEEDAPPGFSFVRSRQRFVFGMAIQQMVLRSDTEMLSVIMAPANVPFFVGQHRIVLVNLGGVAARTVDNPSFSVYEVPMYGAHVLLVGKSIRPERMAVILRALLQSNE